MKECETCKELNEEPNAVFIDDIYIMTAGYYHWRREILYCPTCGKRITHKRQKERNNMADIELVIKMPEEMYDWLKNGFPDEKDAENLWQIVKSGTLLPKGHGRLIDVGDLMPDSDYEDGIFYAISTRQINGTDTIIEADKVEREV